MTKISLEKYLEEQEKINPEQRLSENRIHILKLAKKFADEVNRITKSPRNHVWELVFHGGTFDGNTHIQLRLNQLTPLGLLCAIASEKLSVAYKCEKAILKVLEQEDDKNNRLEI